MKYCSHCGSEIFDEAVICPHCGCSVQETIKATPVNNTSSEKNTIRLIAKVFMILGCISVGWTLIPLIWCIPMTVKYWKACDNGEDVSTAFKICSLLFVNLIAGILMLAEEAVN